MAWYDFLKSTEGQAADIDLALKRIALASGIKAKNAQSTLLGGPQYDGSGNPLLFGDGTPVNYSSPVAPQTLQNNTQAMGAPAQPGMRYASQVSVPGLLGNEALGPDQFAQKRQSLLQQSAPEPFLNQQITEATLVPRLKAAGYSPEQINAFMVAPKEAGEAAAKSAFPTLTDYARDLIAAGLKPGTQGFQQAMADKRAKETYIADLDPLKRADMAAAIAEKYSATEKNKAMTANLAGAGLDDDGAKLIAEQLMAGDPSGLQGLGYGNAGAANRAKVRNAFTQMAAAAGMSGADVAAKNAEFFGTKAGERTIGTRAANMDMAANEANNMAEMAIEASRNVNRGSFVPFNQIENAYKAGTSDPNYGRFIVANNSLINAYAMAVGKGTPTVSGQEHAREMLSTATSQRDYEARIDQLKKEMNAALASPGQAREALRNSITGKGENAGSAPTAGAYTWHPETGLKSK